MGQLNVGRAIALLSTISLVGCKFSEEPKAAQSEKPLDSNCSVTQEVNGATIRCGNTTAFVADGSSGSAGNNGANGNQGPVGPEGPRGLQGPVGSASSSDFWLVKIDGTPIGQIITWTGGPNFVLWDDVHQYAASFEGNGGDPSWLYMHGRNMTELLYTTADCSDSPHSSATQAGEYGGVPNTGFALGGSVYRVEATWDTITAVAFRKENLDGSMTACTPAVGPSYASNLRPRLTKIINPSLPVTIDYRTYKIEKR
jgi:hypothetical protein